MQQSFLVLSITALAAMILSMPLIAEELEPDFSSELPRFPHVPADQAIETFELVEGFGLELAAAEPLVTDPVAMSFDADGRLYVVEMNDYSEHPEDNLGRVRVLEDTDGDGTMDKATVFARGLSWPTAIICWDGGVFIGIAPDIHYMKDTDGDGVADQKKVVYTGFGRSNVQGLMNTFLWGLDNRIHIATSVSGAQVTRPDKPGEPPLNVNGRDFAFDPHTLEMSTVTGGGQHGATFDDWGTRFVSSNSNHLQMIIYEDRYLQRSTGIPNPAPRISIASDGPQADVFRISPVEPWRVVRTRMRRKQGVGLERGGRVAGYFTGSTGVTLYRGDAWPQEHRGMAFISDAGGNLIHRKRLTRNGVIWRGNRIDEQTEFLATTDLWFRGVQMANAPDGNLWIMDMYRETIEHPLSLPAPIKKHLDLDSGNDRGRLYRVVWKGSRKVEKSRTQPNLSHATTEQLVELLSHPNAWHRETAARLIYEQQDPAAAPLLQRMVFESESPLGRIHAMYAMQGLGKLSMNVIHRALADDNPRVKEHAIRLSEAFVNDNTQTRRALYALTRDPDIRVRFQLAFTLGEITVEDPHRSRALVEILQNPKIDSHVEFAVMSSIGDGAAGALANMIDAKGPSTATIARRIQSLSRLVTPGDVKTLAPALLAAKPQVAGSVLRGMQTGRIGSKWRATLNDLPDQQGKSLLDRILTAANDVATDTDAVQAERLSAIDILALGSYDESGETLASLILPTQPESIQGGAVKSLAGIYDDRSTQVLISAVPQAGPAVQPGIIDALLTRTDRAIALLDAIEAGKIAPGLISPDRRVRLRGFPDATVKSRAASLLAVDDNRQKIIDRYAADMADLKGDPDRGKLVFITSCSICHKVDGVGQELGPNLVEFAKKGPDGVLLNVLDPNREINPDYLNYIITTKDNRVITGMITSQTATSLTLTAGAGVVQSVLRADIATIQNTGASIMPVGLEAAINPQQMADLLAYLTHVSGDQP